MYSINSVYGHCGWMFGVSTVFVLSMECLGLDFKWGVNTFVAYLGRASWFFIYLFIFLWPGV